MLTATSLKKIIQNRVVLDTLSLTIERGKITSVVGPSGSGKTTLLRALALVDPADQGTIAIDNDTFTFPRLPTDTRSPYPRLTVVFQQLFIWPHLTIRDNLILPLNGVIDSEHFRHLTELFQMTPFLDRYPNEVSIGQRQRAALVRALLLHPTYLLLDEVTSALDIEQSQLILSHLREIADTGVGVLWVSHAIHLAAAISDHILFMDQGKIIESGTPNMLKTPRSQRLKDFMAADIFR